MKPNELEVNEAKSDVCLDQISPSQTEINDDEKLIVNKNLPEKPNRKKKQKKGKLSSEASELKLSSNTDVTNQTVIDEEVGGDFITPQEIKMAKKTKIEKSVESFIAAESQKEYSESKKDDEKPRTDTSFGDKGSKKLKQKKFKHPVISDSVPDHDSVESPLVSDETAVIKSEDDPKKVSKTYDSEGNNLQKKSKKKARVEHQKVLSDVNDHSDLKGGKIEISVANNEKFPVEYLMQDEPTATNIPYNVAANAVEFCTKTSDKDVEGLEKNESSPIDTAAEEIPQRVDGKDKKFKKKKGAKKSQTNSSAVTDEGKESKITNKVANSTEFGTFPSSDKTGTSEVSEVINENLIISAEAVVSDYEETLQCTIVKVDEITSQSDVKIEQQNENISCSLEAVPVKEEIKISVDHVTDQTADKNKKGKHKKSKKVNQMNTNESTCVVAVGLNTGTSNNQPTKTSEDIYFNDEIEGISQRDTISGESDGNTNTTTTSVIAEMSPVIESSEIKLLDNSITGDLTCSEKSVVKEVKKSKSKKNKSKDVSAKQTVYEKEKLLNDESNATPDAHEQSNTFDSITVEVTEDVPKILKKSKKNKQKTVNEIQSKESKICDEGNKHVSISEQLTYFSDVDHEVEGPAGCSDKQTMEVGASTDEVKKKQRNKNKKNKGQEKVKECKDDTVEKCQKEDADTRKEISPLSDVKESDEILILEECKLEKDKDIKSKSDKSSHEQFDEPEQADANKDISSPVDVNLNICSSSELNIESYSGPVISENSESHLNEVKQVHEESLVRNVDSKKRDAIGKTDDNRGKHKGKGKKQNKARESDENTDTTIEVHEIKNITDKETRLTEINLIDSQDKKFSEDIVILPSLENEPIQTTSKEEQLNKSHQKAESNKKKARKIECKESVQEYIKESAINVKELDKSTVEQSLKTPHSLSFSECDSKNEVEGEEKSEFKDRSNIETFCEGSSLEIISESENVELKKADQLVSQEVVVCGEEKVDIVDSSLKHSEAEHSKKKRSRKQRKKSPTKVDEAFIRHLNEEGSEVSAEQQSTHVTSEDSVEEAKLKCLDINSLLIQQERLNVSEQLFDFSETPLVDSSLKNTEPEHAETEKRKQREQISPAKLDGVDGKRNQLDEDVTKDITQSVEPQSTHLANEDSVGEAKLKCEDVNSLLIEQKRLNVSEEILDSSETTFVDSSLKHTETDHAKKKRSRKQKDKNPVKVDRASEHLDEEVIKGNIQSSEPQNTNLTNEDSIREAELKQLDVSALLIGQEKLNIPEQILDFSESSSKTLEDKQILNVSEEIDIKDAISSSTNVAGQKELCENQRNLEILESKTDVIHNKSDEILNLKKKKSKSKKNKSSALQDEGNEGDLKNECHVLDESPEHHSHRQVPLDVINKVISNVDTNLFQDSSATDFIVKQNKKDSKKALKSDKKKTVTFEETPIEVAHDCIPLTVATKSFLEHETSFSNNLRYPEHTSVDVKNIDKDSIETNKVSLLNSDDKEKSQSSRELSISCGTDNNQNNMLVHKQMYSEIPENYPAEHKILEGKDIFKPESNPYIYSDVIEITENTLVPSEEENLLSQTAVVDNSEIELIGAPFANAVTVNNEINSTELTTVSADVSNQILDDVNVESHEVIKTEDDETLPSCEVPSPGTLIELQVDEEQNIVKEGKKKNSKKKSKTCPSDPPHVTEIFEIDSMSSYKHETSSGSVVNEASIEASSKQQTGKMPETMSKKNKKKTEKKAIKPDEQTEKDEIKRDFTDTALNEPELSSTSTLSEQQMNINSCEDGFVVNKVEEGLKVSKEQHKVTSKGKSTKRKIDKPVELEVSTELSNKTDLSRLSDKKQTTESLLFSSDNQEAMSNKTTELSTYAHKNLTPDEAECASSPEVLNIDSPADLSGVHSSNLSDNFKNETSDQLLVVASTADNYLIKVKEPIEKRTSVTSSQLDITKAFLESEKAAVEFLTQEKHSVAVVPTIQDDSKVKDKTLSSFPVVDTNSDQNSKANVTLSKKKHKKKISDRQNVPISEGEKCNNAEKILTGEQSQSISLEQDKELSQNLLIETPSILAFTPKWLLHNNNTSAAKTLMSEEKNLCDDNELQSSISSEIPTKMNDGDQNLMLTNDATLLVAGDHTSNEGVLEEYVLSQAKECGIFGSVKNRQKHKGHQSPDLSTETEKEIKTAKKQKKKGKSNNDTSRSHTTSKAAQESSVSGAPKEDKKKLFGGNDNKSVTDVPFADKVLDATKVSVDGSTKTVLGKESKNQRNNQNISLKCSDDWLDILDSPVPIESVDNDNTIIDCEVHIEENSLPKKQETLKTVDKKSSDDQLNKLDIPAPIESTDETNDPEIIKGINQLPVEDTLETGGKLLQDPGRSIALKGGDDWLDILDSPMPIECSDDEVTETQSSEEKKPFTLEDSISQDKRAVSEDPKNCIFLKSGEDWLDILDSPVPIEIADDGDVSEGKSLDQPKENVSEKANEERTVIIKDDMVSQKGKKRHKNIGKKISLRGGEDQLDISDNLHHIKDVNKTCSKAKSHEGPLEHHKEDHLSDQSKESKIHENTDCDVDSKSTDDNVLNNAEPVINTPNVANSLVFQDIRSVQSSNLKDCYPSKLKEKESHRIDSDMRNNKYKNQKEDAAEVGYISLVEQAPRYNTFSILDAERRFAERVTNNTNNFETASSNLKLDTRKLSGERVIFHAEDKIEEIPEEKCDEMKVNDPDTPKRFVDDDFFKNYSNQPKVDKDCISDSTKSGKEKQASENVLDVNGEDQSLKSDVHNVLSRQELPVATIDSEGFIKFIPKKNIHKEKLKTSDKANSSVPNYEHQEVPNRRDANRVASVGSNLPSVSEHSEDVIKKDSKPNEIQNDSDGSSDRIIRCTNITSEIKKDGIKSKSKDSTEVKIVQSLNTSVMDVDTSPQLHTNNQLQTNLLMDNFWINRRSYHDAEVNFFEAASSAAKKSKPLSIEKFKQDNDDDNNDGPSSSGPSSPNHENKTSFISGDTERGTEKLTADLPSGLGGWSDYSTYISDEDPTKMKRNAADTEANDPYRPEDSSSKVVIIKELNEADGTASTIHDGLSDLPSSDSEIVALKTDLAGTRTEITTLKSKLESGKSISQDKSVPKEISPVLEMSSEQDKSIPKEISPVLEMSSEKQPSKKDTTPSPVPEVAKDDTLASIESPIPDEEVLGVSPIPVDIPKSKYEVQVVEAGSQTGRSLVVSPEQKLMTTEVQTDSIKEMPSAVAIQTEKFIVEELPKSHIHIIQKIGENEETIEIATKSKMVDVIDESVDIPQVQPDDVTLEVKYKEKKQPDGVQEIGSISELNIIHTDPQSFETVIVDPDETSTEVIVDKDGSKRIIVRKLRRTVVSHQQRILTESKTVEGFDVKPLAFSQVSLQQQQKSTTETVSGGTVKYMTSQGYVGQISSGIPGGEVKTSDFPIDISGIESGVLIPEEGQTPPGELVSSSNVRAVVQQVSRKVVRKTRKVIRRIVNIDGKEHITEEVIEEPDEVELSEQTVPRVCIEISRGGSGNVIIQEPGDEPQEHPHESSLVEISEILPEEEKQHSISEPTNKLKELEDPQQKTSKIHQADNSKTSKLFYKNKDDVSGKEISQVNINEGEETRTISEANSFQNTEKCDVTSPAGETGLAAADTDSEGISQKGIQPSNLSDSPKQSMSKSHMEEFLFHEKSIGEEYDLNIHKPDPVLLPQESEKKSKKKKGKQKEKTAVTKDSTEDPAEVKEISEKESSELKHKSPKKQKKVEKPKQKFSKTEKIPVVSSEIEVAVSGIDSPKQSDIEIISETDITEPLNFENKSQVIGEIISSEMIEKAPLCTEEILNISKVNSGNESVLSQEVSEEVCNEGTLAEEVHDIPKHTDVSQDIPDVASEIISPDVKLKEDISVKSPSLNKKDQSKSKESTARNSAEDVNVQFISAEGNIASFALQPDKNIEGTESASSEIVMANLPDNKHIILEKHIHNDKEKQPEILKVDHSSVLPGEVIQKSESFLPAKNLPTGGNVIDKPYGDDQRGDSFVDLEKEAISITKIEPGKEIDDKATDLIKMVPEQPVKNVEISLSIKEHTANAPVSPKMISSVKVERSITEPFAEMEVVKEEKYVRLPTTVEVLKVVEVPEYVNLPVSSSSSTSSKKEKKKDTKTETSEDLSVPTSLAESTELCLPGSDSSETVKPTENEFDIISPRSALSGVEESVSSQDPGYEPEDKTTMDDASVAEDDDRSKNKKKKKKKQKVKTEPVAIESGSIEPKSSDFIPSDETNELTKEGTLPEKTTTKSTKKKDKKGKKTQIEEPKKEIFTAKELEETNKSDSWQEFSDKTPLSPVKVLENRSSPGPTAEITGDFISREIIFSVPVLEEVPTQHETIQTVTPEPEKQIVETAEIYIQTTKEQTQEGQVQTDTPEGKNIPELSETSVQTIEKEVSEERTQTITPEEKIVVEKVDTDMQTIAVHNQEEEVQTEGKICDNIESSMQTESEEKVISIEEVSQTSPEPAKLPVSSQVEKGDIVTTEDECSQTITPPLVSTSELSVQTKTSEIIPTHEEFSQTIESPKHLKEPERPTCLSDLEISDVTIEEICPIEMSDSIVQTSDDGKTEIRENASLSNLTLSAIAIEEINPVEMTDSVVQVMIESPKSQKTDSSRDETQKSVPPKVHADLSDHTEIPIKTEVSSQTKPVTVKEVKTSRSKRSKFRDKEPSPEDFEIKVQTTVTFTPATPEETIPPSASFIEAEKGLPVSLAREPVSPETTESETSSWQSHKHFDSKGKVSGKSGKKKSDMHKQLPQKDIQSGTDRIGSETLIKTFDGTQPEKDGKQKTKKRRGGTEGEKHVVKSFEKLANILPNERETVTLDNISGDTLPTQLNECKLASERFVLTEKGGPEEADSQVKTSNNPVTEVNSTVESANSDDTSFESRPDLPTDKETDKYCDNGNKEDATDSGTSVSSRPTDSETDSNTRSDSVPQVTARFTFEIDGSKSNPEIITKVQHDRGMSEFLIQSELAPSSATEPAVAQDSSGRQVSEVELVVASERIKQPKKRPSKSKKIKHRADTMAFSSADLEFNQTHDDEGVSVTVKEDQSFDMVHSELEIPKVSESKQNTSQNLDSVQFIEGEKSEGAVPVSSELFPVFTDVDGKLSGKENKDNYSEQDVSSKKPLDVTLTDKPYIDNKILSAPLSDYESQFHSDLLHDNQSDQRISESELAQDLDVKWKQTGHIMLDRIRCLQNPILRSSHTLYLTSEETPNASPEERTDSLKSNIGNLQLAVRSKDPSNIQRTVIITVETISTWLETIEYKIQQNKQASLRGVNPEDALSEINNIQNEISQIESSIVDFKDATVNCKDVIPEETCDDMKKFISSLEEQAKAVESIVETTKSNTQNDLARWEEFLNRINNVSVLVEELHCEIDDIERDQNSTTEDKLIKLERIENENLKHANTVTELLMSAHDLLRDYPAREIPSELYSTDSTIHSNLQSVEAEKEKLLQLMSLADEYEQTLKEFAQITDVAEDLVDSPISVTGLPHLQDEMQKHRKFFVNLSHCRGILESLEGHLDPETRKRFASLHDELHSRASVILDKAAGRSQQMALAASRWTVIEQGMREERGWLQVAHQRVPDLTNVTSSHCSQFISLYQALSSDLGLHHAKVNQLVNMVHGLQSIVSCPGLESSYEEHLSALLTLQDNVNSSLSRLIAFHESWTTYDLLANRLENWMRSVGDVETEPPTSMRQFWELKAQFELHNHIRNEASGHFDTALKIVPVSDENLQRQFHTQLQERWQQLASVVDKLQTSATSNYTGPEIPLDGKLSMLERELKELATVLADMHGVIKTEEELQLYIERLQVMKGGIERIQEELGCLGLLSVSESDRVGSLLSGARTLEISVNDELEGATVLRDRLQAIRRGLARVKRDHCRATSILDQCESSLRLGHDSVQQAVTNCQGVSDTLNEQWQDMMTQRQLLHTLPMRLRLTMSPVRIEREISSLQDEHTVIEDRCKALLASLQQRLALWRRFHTQLEVVHQSVQQADYMMEILAIQGTVDYDRLLKATERLEGLSASLNEKEDQLDELRSAAEPLIRDCEPEVVEQIAHAVEEVATAWEETCTNIQGLCNRYHEAVRLWAQYREASDALSKWADQQTHSTQNIRPENALPHLKVCEETLSAQKQRLIELQEMVAKIAEDVGLEGSGLLQGEVESLGRKLEDVRHALSDLANVTKVKVKDSDTCSQDLNDVKAFLNNLQQTLVKVDVSSDEGAVEQLDALRDHLLALGKADGHIQSLREKSSTLPPAKQDTTVVDVLQLWQQVFRETFQQYHRLSARLVKSQDGAEALRLWQDYLLHVQAFLSTPIPDDYNTLTEHQNLCQVHQNLLASQQALIPNKNDTETSSQLPVVEQFNTLTNMHNETLAKIMERESVVRSRLQAWEQYRKDQLRLLAWLQELEKEKSSLKLHYIHLRFINKARSRIQALLDKIPNGEIEAENLSKQLSSLTQFCDEGLAVPIRMEHAATVDRISSIHAALESWRKHLDNVYDVSQAYEMQTANVQRIFTELNSFLLEQTGKCEGATPTSVSQIKQRLAAIKNASERVNGVATDLNSLESLQKQLNDNVSPMDMKGINQRVWLLRQQQIDLGHQLEMLAYQLEERLQLYDVFDKRQQRFLTWVKQIESRLEGLSVGICEPDQVLRQLETELQAEVVLKRREVDWLVETGKRLAASEGDQKAVIESKVNAVQEAWDRLQQLTNARATKLRHIIQGMSQIETKLEEIRDWLHKIEGQIATPVHLDECTKKELEKKLKQHEDLETSIEKQSSKVGDLLNFFELLLNDCDNCQIALNTEGINLAMKTLEKRWKNVCVNSAEKRLKMIDLIKLLDDVMRVYNDHEEWMKKQEAALDKVAEQVDGARHKQLQKLINEVEVVTQELELQRPALSLLEQLYTRLTTQTSVENVAPNVRNILQRWYNLGNRSTELLNRLNAALSRYNKFINLHSHAVLGLTQADAQLTQLQHIDTADETPLEAAMNRLKKIQLLEADLLKHSEVLKKADILGLEVMESCVSADVPDVQAMIDEYQKLWKDINSRLEPLKLECIQEIKKKQVVNEGVQVETLKFETDTSVQVNTLPATLLRKDAYLYELKTAIKECSDNLDKLQKMQPDVGNTQAVSKVVSMCQSSVELVKHLSLLLEQQCQVSPEEAHRSEVNDLGLRLETLLSRVQEQERQQSELRNPGNMTCPLCSNRTWQQLESDIWRLEQWLQYAEATLASQPSIPPTSIDQLEDKILDHRELLLDMESHKSLFNSLNIVGKHLAEHTADEACARELRERLAVINKRWDEVFASATRWQTLLQSALMENSQFHDVMIELSEWVERKENSIRLTEPVDLTEERAVIEDKYNKLRQLHRDLEQCEPRVTSLEEAANQVLKNVDAPDGAQTARTRLTELRLKLQSLIRLTSVYILKLGAVLGHQPNELGVIVPTNTSLDYLAHELLDEAAGGQRNVTSTSTERRNSNEDTTVLTRGTQFLGRVLRASLPIQALMLLILGVATLVPVGEEDYSCILANTFARSLEPMLRYDNGPPPI